MRKTARLALLGLLPPLLAACGSIPGLGSAPAGPPGPPAEVLVRVEKALAANDPEGAWRWLDTLDEETLQAENLEKFLFYQACAYYRQNAHWDSFKKLRELSSRFPVTRYASRIAWMEFQIGRSLLDARGGFLGLLSYRSYGLQVLRHLTITWPDQTEPGRPKNIIADDALALLAELKWGEREWQDAIDRYSQLVTNYSGSEWATLAYFRIAMSWYNLIEGIPYDLEVMRTAERELRQLLDAGKGMPAQKEEAAQALAVVREMLAARSLQTARYYMTLESPPGVVLHLREAIEGYPGTAAAGHARRALPLWKRRAAAEKAR